ncbi:type VI toxin-antitoxin system SocA family antitoxin [Pseudochelatococcus sp. B33]
MNDSPHDPRAVANLMLDEADRSETQVSNLVLQKLLYFAHAIFLIETKRPLVSGYFEAWKYGPVHPAVYSAFKSAGSRPIDFRATRQNILTGERSEIELPTDPIIRKHIRRIINSYGTLSPGRLVDISHAKDAPWHYIEDKGRTSVALGLRIPDDVIVKRFKFHKVSVGATPVAGEPDEDTPLT